MDQKSDEWLVLDVLAREFDVWDSDRRVGVSFIEERLKELGTPLSKDQIGIALEKLIAQKHILGFPKEKPKSYNTGMVGFLGWWAMRGEPVNRSWEK